jgi:hypothetical protein
MSAAGDRKTRGEPRKKANLGVPQAAENAKAAARMELTVQGAYMCDGA